MATTNLGRIGFVLKGNWVAGTYKRLDVVSYNGTSWSCQATTTTGEPSISPDWVLMVNQNEWGAEIVSQAEAEAGTETTARKWTAQRVRQAVVAWWDALTNVSTAGNAITITQSGTGRALRSNGQVDIRPNGVSPTYSDPLVPAANWSKVAWANESTTSTATFSGLTVGAMYEVEWSVVSGSYFFNVFLDADLIAYVIQDVSKAFTFIASATEHTVAITPLASTTATISTPTMRQVLTRGGSIAMRLLDDANAASVQVRSFITARFNNAFGVNSLSNNTLGYNNCAFGRSTLQNNTTGQGNSAFGHVCLTQNTSGYENAAFGRSAMNANRTGFSNSAFGVNALGVNTHGSANTAVGLSALLNTQGNRNSAIGWNALSNNTTGANNCAFGANAGMYAGAGSTSNATSNGSTYIGYQVRAGANGNTNEIVIGNDAIGAGSNTTTLGNASTTLTRLHGNTVQITASRTPASATAAGTAGEICWDATHIYVCIATNTWRRIAHASW